MSLNEYIWVYKQVKDMEACRFMQNLHYKIKYEYETVH